MDSSAPEASRRTARTSLVESIRGCTLAGVRISKEELRRKLTMPEYLRLAMTGAIKSENIDAAVDRHRRSANDAAESPEFPLVVFINSKSGGRHGPKLKARLEDLMAKEQVFDLQLVKPHQFVEYGLRCLEKLADLGDLCAKQTREKLRVVVAGGDGTVGWVLGCLGELQMQGRNPVPPTAVIPLGTGNDLSRSFGWGGSFPFNWKSAIKNTLDRAGRGQGCHLDSWNISISMPAEKIVDRPHCLKSVKECYLDQGLETGELPEKASYHEGVFYNYFSIGMDAQVAYGFHHLRNKKPYLAQGPVSNKDVYQRIMLFMQQSKREICILSASGSITNPSLRQPATSGGNITYEGRFDIISLSGSYIRTELGGRTGGLSVCLSDANGQIIGGGIGGPLRAAGPVQVIVGTFLMDTKKDTIGGSTKGDASTSKFPSPGFHSGVDSSGRVPISGVEDHQNMSGSQFVIQPRAVPGASPPASDWRSRADARPHASFDLTGMAGHGAHHSPENGSYEQQFQD